MAPHDPSSVEMLVHSNTTGTTLVFDWFVYDQSSNLITDPTLIQNVIISASTRTVDGVIPSSVIYQDLSLNTTTGTFIKTGSITGLINTALYICNIEVTFTDGTYCKNVTPQNAKVRGGITSIVPSFTQEPFDDLIQVVIDTSSALQFEAKMANTTEEYPYAGMFVAYTINDGSNTEIRNVAEWNDISNNYTFTVDASNDVTYEAFLSYFSAQPFVAGKSVTVSNGQLTPTDKPNPPAPVVPVSRYEYNRYNASTPYTVTDASAVTVLFNNGPQDPSTNVLNYKIYRTDLSSNGIDPLYPSALVGTISAASSSINSYAPPNYTNVDYSYNFTDPDVTIGNFYGYQVSAVGINGEGLKTTPLVCVKVGKKGTAPIITNSTAGDKQVVLDVSSGSVIPGGFIFNPPRYTVVYRSEQSFDPSGVLTGKSVPIIIPNLKNGATVSYAVYAEISNSFYTGPGYDVSLNKNGDPISYLSAASYGSTTPYAAPNPPSSVSVAPSFGAGNVPTGDVVVSWISDTSFTSNWLNYRITSFDASTNAYINEYYPSDSSGTWPDGSPASRKYTDNTIALGRRVKYTVESYFTTNNQVVYSLPQDSSNNNYQPYYVPSINQGSIIPFDPPTAASVTSVNNYPDASGNPLLTFKVAPAIGTLASLGGLNISASHAKVFSQGSGDVFDMDLSGNDTSGNYTVVKDASGNYTIAIKNLLANSTGTITVYSKSIGPDPSGGSQTTFTSSPTSQTSYGPLIAHPVITGYNVDASSILTITSDNNGSPLNFIEGLVIDNSSNLQLSYAIDISGTTGVFYVNGLSTGMTIVQNSNTIGIATVNFNDSNVKNNSQKLIIVANTSGADVYNTFL